MQIIHIIGIFLLLSIIVFTLETLLYVKVEKIEDVKILSKTREFLPISNRMKKFIIALSLSPILLMTIVFNMILLMDKTTLMDAIKAVALLTPLLFFGIVNLVYLFHYRKEDLKQGDASYKLKCLVEKNEVFIICSEKMYLDPNISISFYKHSGLFMKPFFSVQENKNLRN